MVNNLVKHINAGTPLREIWNMSIVAADKYMLARRLSFEAYYGIQKILGFPVLKRMFYGKNRYYPDLENPRSFSEKCTYLKLFARNPLLPTICDKVAVRKYVSDKIGADVLIPILQVSEQADDIQCDDLPKAFVIKTNYASGQTIVVKDSDKLNWHESVNRVNSWMRMKYRHQELMWFAQQIERKIIIEKLLLDAEGNLPTDFKFYVFQGQTRYINTITDRFTNKALSFFDREWNFVDVAKNSLPTDPHLARPDNLSEMLLIADLLGSEFDFMRVDLYSIDSKVYFGELTAYPGDGRSNFEPSSFDFELGAYWNMDRSHMQK